MSAYDPKRTWLRICLNSFAPINDPGSASQAKLVWEECQNSNIITSELQETFRPYSTIAVPKG